MSTDRSRVTIGVLMMLPLFAGAAIGRSVRAEQPFSAAARVAMDRMMREMMVRPTGNVDADFARMMVPHHRGAIDMAVAELRYGTNEPLRRIAQEIVIEQAQEVAAMQLALKEMPAPAAKR